MEYPTHFECSQCGERVTITEEQARAVAGEKRGPEAAARATAERLHGFVSPPGPSESLVCPDCLTAKGVQTSLALQ